MKTFLGIAILPLICLGGTILTAAVIIFALRRRTQAINQQVQENKDINENGSPANTRWVRGDMKTAPQSLKAREMMKTCPVCGGENAVGSSSCSYCGSAL